MTLIEEQFIKAQVTAKTLSERPDNATILKLYALYKQATFGNVVGERPNSFDLVARAKFDAWFTLKNLPSEIAMQQYIDTVNTLVVV